jgi:hypothetical protein
VVVAAIYFLVYRLPVAVVQRYSFRCPHCNAPCSEHASSCPHCGGSLGSGTSSEPGAAIRQPNQGQQRGARSARTIIGHAWRSVDWAVRRILCHVAALLHGRLPQQLHVEV